MSCLDLKERLGLNMDRYGGSLPVTNVPEFLDVLSELKELRGIQFFHEVPIARKRSGTKPSCSKSEHNEWMATMLKWKCPSLEKVDHWEEGGSVHGSVSGNKSGKEPGMIMRRLLGGR